MDIFSPVHLLILLVIVILIFGTGRLRKMGPDLGHALRDFKKALRGGDDKDAPARGEESLKADPPAAADATQKQAQHDSTGSK